MRKGNSSRLLNRYTTILLIVLMVADWHVLAKRTAIQSNGHHKCYSTINLRFLDFCLRLSRASNTQPWSTVFALNITFHGGIRDTYDKLTFAASASKLSCNWFRSSSSRFRSRETCPLSIYTSALVFSIAGWIQNRTISRVIFSQLAEKKTLGGNSLLSWSAIVTILHKHAPTIRTITSITSLARRPRRYDGGGGYLIQVPTRRVRSVEMGKLFPLYMYMPWDTLII
jgi:hypothetical protein